MYWELKKLREIIQGIKGFNLTKYLLDRKEEKFVDKIILNKGLIESYKQRILAGKEAIKQYEEEIIDAQKTIKQLETDVKKIIKVTNLYID